jgi:hypothetical protein
MAQSLAPRTGAAESPKLFFDPRGLKSLETFPRRPVVLVHTQYLEIKYKKPTFELIQCPVLGAERTLIIEGTTSDFDPQATSHPAKCCL